MQAVDHCIGLTTSALVVHVFWAVARRDSSVPIELLESQNRCYRLRAGIEDSRSRVSRKRLVASESKRGTIGLSDWLQMLGATLITNPKLVIRLGIGCVTRHSQKLLAPSDLIATPHCHRHHEHNPRQRRF
jgi:hypothetical protein